MDRLAEVLQQVEEEIVRLEDHEVGYVFRPDGEVVLRKVAADGRKLALQFSDAERAQIRGCIFTHNHPIAGSSFSPEDIKFAYANRLLEARAVSSQYLFRLRAPEGEGSRWQRSSLKSRAAKDPTR